MPRFLPFIALLISNVFAEEFVLRNDNILIDKNIAKINEMSAELKAKTGAGVYVSVVDKLEANTTIGVYAKTIASELNGSFVLLAISQSDRQIDAIVSPELQTVIDKDDIVCVMPGCPIVPILSERRRDITLQQQIGAGIFNGAAYVVDTIANAREVTLESSVGSGSRNFGLSLTWIVRIMIVLTLAAMFIAWRRGKAEGK
ncbi:MAG: TPM domain-containing protein [Helicobacteraceae bacterium]|jgi:hypothetical protein|nr:TPM domain-containing protein [Helicobacteraceae bacterium]